jgi:hypothetical protein
MRCSALRWPITARRQTCGATVQRRSLPISFDDRDSRSAGLLRDRPEEMYIDEKGHAISAHLADDAWPVSMKSGGVFGYLRGLSGAMRPHYTPKLKKRTALVRALKEVFRQHRSQPIERVIVLINPVLRGWVNYFAVGHSSECFSFIKDWVEKKVRRHLAHAQKRKGFGWERWNRRWLYDTLGLFNAYRVRRDGPKVAPAG